MKNLKTKNIGEIVANDYRTAAIFQKYGIDFCCKGNKTIEEVCEKKKIVPEELLAKLSAATTQTDVQLPDFQTWPLDLLADYIEKKHHRYIESVTPAINQYLDKVCKVHGQHNPELLEINEQFKAASGELAVHMKKEELVLFPYIRKMVVAKLGHGKMEEPGFGTVENPIQMMMHEHDIEGERFRKIAALSNDYTPPAHACNTYRVTFSLLKEFENDLHLHIHLENNILFPKAIALEKEFAAGK